jgi:hypothetical protein
MVVTVEPVPTGIKASTVSVPLFNRKAPTYVGAFLLWSTFDIFPGMDATILIY